MTKVNINTKHLTPKLYASVSDVERDLLLLCQGQRDNVQQPQVPFVSLGGNNDNQCEGPRQRSCATATDYRPPHLFLHFDVNETILIGDPAGGDTVHECLNKIIAKSAFVSTKGFSPETSNNNNNTTSTHNCSSANNGDASLKRSPSSGNISIDSTHNFRPTHWWNGVPLDPCSADGVRSGIVEEQHQQSNASVPPPLYTGWTYPKQTCPYYRTNYKKICKGFTESPHGIIYRPLYEQLCSKLGLYPDPSSEENAPTRHEEGIPTTENEEIFQNFVPAFYDALQYYFPSTRQEGNNAREPETLSTNNTLPKPSKVTLVLRTFGEDLPRVAKVISEFAKGNHPSYPDYFNPNLILEETMLFRSAWSYRGVERDCAYGNEEKEFNYELHPYDSFDESGKENGKPHYSGDNEVLGLLQSRTVLGIRDNYPFWKENNHEPWSGKPVWTRTGVSGQSDQRIMSSNHHHILLDDNIHNDPSDGAGGIRIPCTSSNGGNATNDLASYQSLHGTEALAMHGKYLIRVPAVRPLLEDDWFVRQIEEARWRMFLDEKQ